MELKLKKVKIPEKAIQALILEYLQRKGFFCWKEHSGGMLIDGGQRYMPIGLKGKSDILGLTKEGRFLAIEVKAIGGVVSEYQESFINNINLNGGLGFVATSLEDVLAKGL